MDFTWDLKKARINERKHGVSFVEAVTAFDDPHAVYLEDIVATERGILIARSTSERLLYVVHIEVDEEAEMVRIISARRASRRERRLYEEAR